VRLQTFLTRADDITGFMKARAEVFPGYFPDGVYPPNTLLVVGRLVRPELLVEIEAMAVKSAASSRGRGAAAASEGALRKGRVHRTSRPAKRRRR
jgi:hypothetical protein